jgi:hypothetical protein
MMDATVDVSESGKETQVSISDVKNSRNSLQTTKDCTATCTFYTPGLSGAAEREGNFVLRAALGTAATEGPRKYQKIWVCLTSDYAHEHFLMFISIGLVG